MGVEGFQLVFLLGLFQGPQSSLLPFQGVHLRDQCGYFSGTEILAQNPAIHLTNAVVVASLPSHGLCYLKTIAPLTPCACSLAASRARNRQDGTMPRESRQGLDVLRRRTIRL